MQEQRNRAISPGLGPMDSWGHRNLLERKTFVLWHIILATGNSLEVQTFGLTHPCQNQTCILRSPVPTHFTFGKTLIWRLADVVGSVIRWGCTDFRAHKARVCVLFLPGCQLNFTRSAKEAGIRKRNNLPL